MLDRVNVLIVGRSNVTCLVVARIVDRAGFQSDCVKPEEAAGRLAEAPDLIVLDGGADNRECDGLMAGIATMRRGRGGRPAVLLLSNRNAPPPEPFSDIVDAVVTKPLTPERLQPAIERLLRTS